MIDLKAVQERSNSAEEWVRRDPCITDGFRPLSFREHFGHDVPALLAEIERLRSVAWAKHSAMIDQHAWADHILNDDCAACDEAWKQCDSDFACDKYKRWQAAYVDALSLVIGERAAQ